MFTRVFYLCSVLRQCNTCAVLTVHRLVMREVDATIRAHAYVNCRFVIAPAILSSEIIVPVEQQRHRNTAYPQGNITKEDLHFDDSINVRYALCDVHCVVITARVICVFNKICVIFAAADHDVVNLTTFRIKFGFVREPHELYLDFSGKNCDRTEDMLHQCDPPFLLQVQ